MRDKHHLWVFYVLLRDCVIRDSLLSTDPALMEWFRRGVANTQKCHRLMRRGFVDVTVCNIFAKTQNKEIKVNFFCCCCCCLSWHGFDLYGIQTLMVSRCLASHRGVLQFLQIASLKTSTLTLVVVKGLEPLQVASLDITVHYIKKHKFNTANTAPHYTVERKSWRSTSLKPTENKKNNIAGGAVVEFCCVKSGQETDWSTSGYAINGWMDTAWPSGDISFTLVQHAWGQFQSTAGVELLRLDGKKTSGLQIRIH